MKAPNHLAYRVAIFALLLGGGVGLWWTLQTFSRSNPTNPQAGTNVATAREGQMDEKPDVRRGFTDEELAETLTHGNDEEQGKAAHALFAKLEAADMRRLRQRVDKVSMEIGEKEDYGWILSNEFYRRWGDVAPREALEFLREHEPYWAGMPEAVYFGWARTDPDAAVAAYDPKLEGQYSRTLQEAILKGLSAVDPGKALSFADAQGHRIGFDIRPDNDDDARARYSATWELLNYVPVETPADPFARSIHTWILRDPESALAAMLALKNDSLKEDTLGALFSNWLLRDPDAALVAISRIEDRYLREATIHRAMQAYLLRHPWEALERILKIPPFEDESEPVKLGKRPLPDRFYGTTPTLTLDRMGLVSEAAAAMGAKDGRRAWDVAATIKDDNARAAALGGALAGWLIQDTDGATGFAKEGIRSGSFDSPGGPDFASFAARLVAKRLAQRDFQHATAWVEALPSGPLRDGAIGTAADIRLSEGWDRALREASPQGGVQPDVFQNAQIREFTPVAKWVDSLPASKGRDHAMTRLVYRMGEHDDPRPALKYAALIKNQWLRHCAFKGLAKKLLDRKDKAELKFDFQAWSAANPELAAELHHALTRNEDEIRGTIDE
ncbi:MAG: hypothetical protein V4689_10730 [Verrucomicrobiota bacterium]